MNWAVSGVGMGTKPHSLGGKLGVYAPRCRSESWGTPSRWEWRSREVSRVIPEVRPVAVWVGWGALGRGA